MAQSGFLRGVEREYGLPGASLSGHPATTGIIHAHERMPAQRTARNTDTRASVHSGKNALALSRLTCRHGWLFTTGFNRFLNTTPHWSPLMTAPYTLENTISHWIGGQIHRDSGSRTQDVFNPATGTVARK